MEGKALGSIDRTDLLVDLGPLACCQQNEIGLAPGLIVDGHELIGELLLENLFRVSRALIRIGVLGALSLGLGMGIRRRCSVVLSRRRGPGRWAFRSLGERSFRRGTR